MAGRLGILASKLKYSTAGSELISSKHLFSISHRYFRMLNRTWLRERILRQKAKFIIITSVEESVT